MFGNDKDDDQAQQPQTTENSENVGLATEEAVANEPAQPEAEASPEAAAPAPDLAEPSGDPEVPADDPSKIKDIISPAGGFPKKPDYQYPSIPKIELPEEAAPASDLEPSPEVNIDSTSDTLLDDLLEVKKTALGELSPLIDKLDLPNDDKFHLIMMIIQTSDDQSLVRHAYELAHSIEDESERAQALLDVVNEVNYFTHQPEIGKDETAENQENSEEAAA